MPPLLVQDLNEDILSHICLLTDVYTVLCISRVNKHFRTIALAKHVWLALIHRLSRRLLLDAPPDDVLQVLSPAALVDEVRRATAGPGTWSAGSMLLPTLARQRVIHIGREVIAVHLLLGGRYVFLASQGGSTAESCEFREVETGRRVWSRDGRFGSYSADPLVGGDRVRLLVVAESAPSLSTMQIVEIDLRTGRDVDVVSFPPPAAPVPIYTRVFTQATIVGDFFVCLMDVAGHDLAILLINWRAQTGTWLIFDSLEPLMWPHRITLVPGHVLFTERTPNANRLHIYAFPAAASAWRPIHALDPATRTHAAQVPHTTLDIGPSGPDYGVNMIAFTCGESVLRAGAMDLLVYLSVSRAPRLPLLARLIRGRNRVSTHKARLVRYRLEPASLPVLSSAHLRPTLISAVPAPIRNGIIHIARTGCVIYDWERETGVAVARLDDDARDARPASRELPGSPRTCHLSVNGAVTTVVGTSVVVSYYL
ncbi:hypothetical protein B0H10DRAFT_2070087 [Mycena sp. CBHHK59/15]|nr:hypothetical protein B0H10DRAFT_2125419 [Mycena sp. CBHHK59/15]KAJ6607866.1 hypothetical protein B0H10DRAFT_2070087 [Mycena sp. CBHHK59/15]